ncbi:MAG: ABC transporter ATP-binding protein [Candidatus Zixiibacteriota bacterium]|nr:MAG: ABC transporter ATP-binding protein [candidate division Zixibacteria bacterium]
MKAIEVDNMCKRYGDVKAVADFSFHVEKGELLALVGPDGAGKTSIFRALCNLIDYDSGEIRILGYDQRTQFEIVKPLLGYMPQTFSLYPDLSVEENLSFYAGLFGITRDQLEKRKARLYEFSGLGPFAGRRALQLSGGMKQKLALSCNLVHEPEVLILDEPTTGVDPLSRRQFWNILKSLKEGGAAIVVSTPYMDEVALADRAIFIYDGKKLTEGTPKELLRQFGANVYRADIFPTSERMNDLSKIDGITARRFGSSIHLYTDRKHPIESLGEALVGVGIKQDMLERIDPELEDVFIQLMGQ